MAPPSFVSVVLSAFLILYASVCNVHAFKASGSLFDSFHTFSRRTSVVSRAAIVLPSGWISHGCVREPTASGARTLTDYSFTSASLTVTSCVAKCDSLGYKYGPREKTAFRPKAVLCGDLMCRRPDSLSPVPNRRE
ncbi:hypothetical protein C8F04DRAFT_107209 [Mycena alexandri]|uniref:Secreted protein n=1 Tax=Mycena alexandri TaxID=1745969 RepID=A0AAD6SFG3_9AGAR|nr:hypothetical protein C8F04DRAFT_107209 [Mycena alexandri]